MVISPGLIQLCKGFFSLQAENTLTKNHYFSHISMLISKQVITMFCRQSSGPITGWTYKWRT